MYFIKYNPLKKQLRERSLTDRDALPYYVLFVATSTFVSLLPLKTSSGLDMWYASISTIITILGTIYTYNKNGGRKGYDFIQKSVVLGWIILVRCGLPLFFLHVFAGILIKKALNYPLGTWSWVDVFLSSILLIIFYQRFGRHIQDTNR